MEEVKKVKEMEVFLNFDNTAEVKNFIHETESGIYTATNTDNEQVRIFINKGLGMDVKTLQKNNWWRVHEYDQDGYFVSETFERERKNKEEISG